MQNIPESVKALFRRDNVRKNLRISFPDGQMPDITNDNIVSESLRFDESISTRDTFTFGLADGSTISFETVGIGNMLGYRIEASLEIDASTLPAELQTVKADVPFPVYSFPLGSFVVTSCPRNHQAMAHRKVTAKSGLTVDAGMMSPVIHDIFYLSGDWRAPKGNVPWIMPLSVDTMFRVMVHDSSEPEARYINSDSQALDLTTVSLSDWINLYYDGVHALRGTGTSQLRLYTKRAAYISPTYTNNPAVGTLEHSMVRLSTDVEPISSSQLVSVCESLTDELLAANPDGIYYTSLSDRIYLNRGGVLKAVIESILNEGNAYTQYNAVYGAASASAELPLHLNEWMPLMALKPNTSTTGIIFGTDALVAAVSATSPRHYLVDSTQFNCTYEYYYKPTADCDTFKAQNISIKAHNVGKVSNRNEYRNQFLDSDLLDIYMSAVEMSGGVVQYKHGGGQQIRFLSKDSPVRVTRDLYEKLWWDEYDIEPIGSVAYKWKDAEQVYQFGEGRSTYQLTNNGLIDALPRKKESGTRLGSGGGTSTATVEAILDAGLVPHLADSTYTPIELTAKGMPFLEPGDYIEIETDTGELVKSYILSRKLKGIQHLTDSITADGTTIVEVM